MPIDKPEQATRHEPEPQKEIKDTRATPPQPTDKHLCTACLKIPFQIQEGGEGGECPQHDKQYQEKIFRRFHLIHESISTVREPSGCSVMVTFITSPGKSSSIFSGHSIKQIAPL